MKPFLIAIALLVLSSAPAPVSPNALATTHSAGEQKEETVYFNTKTLKYHCMTCQHAKRCTKSCIAVPRSTAIANGGVACKVCGGTCR